MNSAELHAISEWSRMARSTCLGSGCQCRSSTCKSRVSVTALFKMNPINVITMNPTTAIAIASPLNPNGKSASIPWAQNCVNSAANVSSSAANLLNHAATILNYAANVLNSAANVVNYVANVLYSGAHFLNCAANVSSSNTCLFNFVA